MKYSKYNSMNDVGTQIDIVTIGQLFVLNVDIFKELKNNLIFTSIKKQIKY